jgi:EmrB/QacA subfamily drug resistance transporter
MTERKPSTLPPGQKLALAAQFGLIAGPFLSMVDSNVVNVALPVMLSDFHSTLSAVQWVLSAYLLASGAALVCSPYLSKRFGANRVYLLSLLGFTGASGLCALAPSLGFLILARVVQGALGAVMVPLAMDMLLGKGGASKQISPAFGIILFLAPALGPTLGGFLIGLAGWPSIFLINVPLGLLSAFAISRGLRVQRTPQGEAPRFDFTGATILAAGVVLALYGASEGPLIGWTTTGSFPYWASGIVLLVAYGLWAVSRPDPAVDLKLLRDGQTALALAIITVAGTVLFAMLFLLPVFMESIQGESAMTAGLALLPQGVVTGIGTWIGDKLSKQRSEGSIRLTTLLGMVILTATTGMLLAVGIGTPDWEVSAILSGRGLALGLTIQPLLYATIGNLADREVPDGNTLFNVIDRLGGSVGISLLATFFQLREQSYASSAPPGATSLVAEAALHSFHDTISLLTVASLLGAVLALLLKRKDGDSSRVAQGSSRGRGYMLEGGKALHRLAPTLGVRGHLRGATRDGPRG